MHHFIHALRCLLTNPQDSLILLDLYNERKTFQAMSL